jgi:hypothetical protein
MLSQTLLKKPEGLNSSKLNHVVWEREEFGAKLKSVIQLSDPPYDMEGIDPALVIHQYVGFDEALQQGANGDYHLSKQQVVLTEWSNIFITPQFIMVDGKGNIGFVKDTINFGLKLQPNTVHGIFLDIGRIATEHEEHWIRGFDRRAGNVDHGVLYGNAVERDAVFGRELKHSGVRVVGWVTNFFGSPTKVKATTDGCISVWSWPSMNLFREFIEKEISPYIIELKV